MNKEEVRYIIESEWKECETDGSINGSEKDVFIDNIAEKIMSLAGEHKEIAYNSYIEGEVPITIFECGNCKSILCSTISRNRMPDYCDNCGYKVLQPPKESNEA